jgi:hypothetical protein
MVLFLLGASFGLVQEPPTGLPPERIEEWFKAQPESIRKAFLMKRLAEMPPKTVYGKVLDEQGSVLSNANVTISWFSFEALWGLAPGVPQQKTVTSGVDGRFQFECEKAASGSIQDAHLDGYEWINRGETGRLFAERGLTEAEPVVIVLRKMKPLSFLLRCPNTFNQLFRWFADNETNHVHRSMDILQSEEDMILKRKEQHDDLILDADWDGTNKKWMVTISTTNTNDGLILNEKAVYEAPDNGYVRKVTFEVSGNQRKESYLCLKTRSPVVYTCLKMEYEQRHDLKTGSWLKFIIWRSTNPYGERTFEYDERYNQFLQEKPKWIEEAKTALREGRYPEKIDIEALIKAKQEAEEKAGKKP